MNISIMLKLLQNLRQLRQHERLTRELAAEGVRVPRIRVQHVAAIPKAISGKAPQIKAHRLSSPLVDSPDKQ
jgi:hypothetical protein